MEGYILLVRSPYSLFSGGNTMVWAVLDGCQLSYYKKYDTELQQPVEIKAMFILNSESEILKTTEICLKVSTQKETILFDCRDSDNCSAWFKALNRATQLEKDEENRQSQQETLINILEIDPDVKLSRSVINKSYKRLSLRAHPDKGGDPDEFIKINMAFTTLLAIQAVVDEKESSKAIWFEIMIKKGSNGFGICFIEDPYRRQVIVESVNENINVVGISAEGEEGLRPGDALIGIDNNDCSQWFLSRIRARLGPTRYVVGVNDVVRFTFERRIPLDIHTIVETSPSPSKREKTDVEVSSPTEPVLSEVSVPVVSFSEEKHSATEENQSVEPQLNTSYNSCTSMPPNENELYSHNSTPQKEVHYSEPHTLLDCENDRISSSQSNLALEEEISILKEQLEAAKRREKIWNEMMESKNKYIESLEAQIFTATNSCRRLEEDKERAHLDNDELRFRITSLMKIVDNCNSNNKSLSERHQVDMLVSLTNKVAALERENKELSALIATARYAFKVQGDILHQSYVVGDNDPRDSASLLQAQRNEGGQQLDSFNRNRLRIDTYNERLQRTKKLEKQLVSALLGGDE